MTVTNTWRNQPKGMEYICIPQGIEGMAAGVFLLYDDKSYFLTLERFMETLEGFYL